jgi:hypothetical protein
MSDEEFEQVIELVEEPKEFKLFKVVSKPEGEPTFVDDSFGFEIERPYMIQTVLLAENEKLARKLVDAQNWDLHLSGDLLYEVVSVEEE